MAVTTSSNAASRVLVVTSASQETFPASVATVNGALQFHPDASVAIQCGDGTALTPMQEGILTAAQRVRLVAADAARAGGAGAAALAQACRGLEADVVVWLAAGAVLCAPVDDVIDTCWRSQVTVTDALESPQILVVPVARDDRLGEPAPDATPRAPQARLDPRIWGSSERHSASVVDFRDGQFVNVTVGLRQRMFRSDAPFEAPGHRERLLEGHAGMTYPYVWFLAMLWFGQSADWSLDPARYLPVGTRHVFDDLIYFLPQIVQVLPRARHAWNGLTDAMITRALDGVPRMLALEDSMRDVLSLVALHPWIRRYVEIGSYEGGSILTLALRFAVRDIDFYAVESFTGNLDGTSDGAPLPSRQRFLAHLSRFPGCRVHLVPGASERAAALFDDASLDCVFIDGCHDTPAVLRDIDAWLPKLRRPAILAGDDYNMDSVSAAVDSRFAGVHITRGGAIWWVALP